jgi:hypothetical protein
LQQGSAPQIGVELGEGDPAGNQQQQPLQSVHDASAGSGLHAHDEASPPVFDFASVVPESVGAFDPLLPLEGTVVPLLLPVLLPLLPLPLLLPVLLPVVLPLPLPLPLPLLPLPLLPPVLLPLLPVDAPAASAPVDPVEPDPPSSLGEPVPLVPLLQAASPTVDDAPMTTIAWKSFSIFMKRTIPPDG